MSKGFVYTAYAQADESFFRELRYNLEAHGINFWTKSTNLHSGKKLAPEIEQAILSSTYVIAILSPRTINSPWVRKEIQFAEESGHNVIPLLLSGIEPSALNMWFDVEPLEEAIELEVGKLNEQLPHILAALGQGVPDHYLPKAIEVESKPVVELLLELSEPTFTRDDNGKEVLSARAEISFIPPDLSQEREVKSRPFRFTAPIGQIEQDEIRWYLEQYLHWPVGLFRERAEKTEAQLPEWGKALYNATLGQDVCREPLNAWQQSRSQVELHLSIQVDAHTLGADGDAGANSNEAASRLQSLPWELLHDGAYLSHGSNPVHIRHRLPNFKHQPPSSAELPIRILLLSPRPEEEGVGYIDHRASALPLVQALETLGDLVQLTVLSPPTLPALEKELHSAREANEPYHVLHFDGYGVYDRQFGLGALCFEHPQDAALLEGRRSELVYNLSSLLKDFRIPLVFLEASQAAQAETSPNASVAASLLEEGVTSVVAMSHNVLVETARRFVTEFYQSLALGQRVGAAMLAGRKTLMHDSFRLQIAGAGDLHLQDWFVPILYQEQHDPQLFARIPSKTAQKMQAQQRQTRLGRMPEPPPHTFIGRSRDLLKAERLLEQQPYAVIRGQGGAGKTTLAVELATWLVKSRRFDRCAFVSVEEYTHESAVVEVLLQQLVNANHNLAAEYDGDIDKALQAIRHTLKKERTLIVVDNMESLLADEANKHAVLDLLAKLPNVKLLFTTRESLPKPFHHKAREIELSALDLRDAKALIMQVMNQEGLILRHDDTGNTPKEVSDLVNSVGCHARALVLLTRELAQRGVSATTANVREVMEELEQRHPGQRENSLFASVELSLRYLSPKVREQVVGLAVFQDGGHSLSMAGVLEVESEQITEIIHKLMEVGLANPIGEYGYIRLDPALAVYLDLALTQDQRELYQQRWQKVMGQLLDFLYEQLFKDTKFAFSLAQLELPNLLSYLKALVAAWQVGLQAPEVVTDKLGRVEQLLANLKQPQAMVQVEEWREQVAQSLGEQSSGRFNNERMNIERLLKQGNVQRALHVAKTLLQQCQQAGEEVYLGADYDLAMANYLLGGVLKTGGAVEAALPYLQEAQQRFEAQGEVGERMASVALTARGDCLVALGQLESAAASYKEGIHRSEKQGDIRSVAVAKGQLASVRLSQKRYDDALQGYQQVLELFNQLGEVGAVATAWHQMGMIYQQTDNFEKAEQAYRQSMSIEGQQGNKVGEARSLGELGNLYNAWSRSEQAVNFYRQAADIYVTLGDLLYEGSVRSNIANTLIELQRYDEARIEVLRAIECKKAFGHAAEPWITWSILHDLEQANGNPQAARAASQNALAAYLAYRRDGGENHSGAGRLALSVRQVILQNDTSEIEQVIGQLLRQESWRDGKYFLYKIKSIISGERDIELTEDEGLSFDMAAELILLLESLAEQPE